MTAVTAKMELFKIIVNGWKPLTIITSSSILAVAAVLDPPLKRYKKVHPVRHTSLSFTWVKLCKRPEVSSEPTNFLHIYK